MTESTPKDKSEEKDKKTEKAAKETAPKAKIGRASCRERV